jgi:hypothetical protein
MEPFVTKFERCREIATRSVASNLGQYAAAIGLKDSVGEQFQHDLTRAITICLGINLDKQKRGSEMKRELLRVKKKAATATRALRDLQAALDGLTPLYRDEIFKNLEMPLRTALRVETLSNAAWIYAKAMRDEGGRPKMLAFAFLVTWLARAFQNATGSEAKVTWNDHRERWEGKFMAFIEIVLPLVLDIGKQLGQPLPYPKSERARGKYVYDATRRGSKMALPGP